MMPDSPSCLTEDEVGATAAVRKTHYWTEKAAEGIAPAQPKFRVFDPNQMVSNDGNGVAQTPVVITSGAPPKTPWTFPRRSSGNNHHHPFGSQSNVTKSSGVSRYFHRTPSSMKKNNKAPAAPGEQLQQQTQQHDQDESFLVTPRSMTFRKFQISSQKRSTYLEYQEQFHMQQRQEEQGKSRVVVNDQQSSSMSQDDISTGMKATRNEILLLPSSLLPYWCLLTIGSAMCLMAIAASTPETHPSVLEQSTQGDHDFQSMQMSMAIATLSMILSFVASLLYLLAPSKFVGTLYEVTVIGLNVVFWCAELPITMNPYNQLAIRGASMTIVNGNLFILTWGCFFLSWILLKWVLDQIQLMDIVPSSTNPMVSQSFLRLTRTLAMLLGLLLSSMVAMVASARSFQIRSCNSAENQTETDDDMAVAYAFNPYQLMCRRITFSLIASVISFAGILLTLILRGCKARQRNTDGSVPPRWWHLTPKSRAGLAGLSTLIWLVTLLVTSFGLNAPAYCMSNYFLSLWTSFGLSFYLFKQTLKGFLVQRRRDAQQVQQAQTLPVLEDEEMSPEEGEMNFASETPPSKHQSTAGPAEDTPQSDANVKTPTERTAECTAPGKENDMECFFPDYCSSVDDDASLHGLDLDDPAAVMLMDSPGSSNSGADVRKSSATPATDVENFSPVHFNTGLDSAIKKQASHPWGVRILPESDNEQTMIFEDLDPDMSVLSAATTRTTNSSAFRANVVTPGRLEFSAFVNGDEIKDKEHEFSVVDPFSPSLDDDCPLNTPPSEGYHHANAASCKPVVIPFSIEKEVTGAETPFDFV